MDDELGYIISDALNDPSLELEQLIRIIDDQIHDLECHRTCCFHNESSVCALKRLRIAAAERLKESRTSTTWE